MLPSLILCILTLMEGERDLYYASLITPVGRIWLVGDGVTLWRARLGEEGELLEEVRSVFGAFPSPSEEMLKGPLKELSAYFQGRLRSFSTPLRLEGTPFELRVWERLRDVPFGETISYGRLAEAAGAPRASRAVGRAVGKNPLLIFVPCHRVIGSDGTLKGFTAPGGVEMKRRLLEHERRCLKRRISPSPSRRRSAS